jgi:tetratricopeptide (TPR) repeat protein
MAAALSVPGTNSRSKAVRMMAERARKLAMAGRWTEAIEVNKELVERSPRDVDALNRLGKSYFELGQYRSAYDAYHAATEADPANIIARRSLERLEQMRDLEEPAPDHPTSVPPARYGVFVEEAGKTYVDELIDPAPVTVLRTVSAGEKLNINIDGERVVLTDAAGVYVGGLAPRIARRLIWLIQEFGNQYEVFVTANAGDSVRIILREAYRNPEMGERVSFPNQGKVAVPRAYLRDARLFRADEEGMLIGGDEDEDLERDEDELDADAEEAIGADEEDDDTEYIDEEQVGEVIDEDE